MAKGAIYNYASPVVQPDPPPTSGNITAADIASATNTGAASQSIVTGTPTVGSSLSTTFTGIGTVRCQVSGTFVGTLSFEQSIDGGVTWCVCLVSITGTSSTATTTTTIGAFFVAASGTTGFRVRCTAFTSGTAVAYIQPGN